MSRSRVQGRRADAQGESGAASATPVEPSGVALRPFAIALCVIAFASAALSTFQWVELLHAREGATTFCAIDKTFDCVSVWESPAAKDVHRLTRLPVAGWGLVWGLGSLAAAALLLFRVQKSRALLATVAAIDVFAAVGLLVSIALFAVSMSMGVFCITCIGTYSIVLAYSIFAYKLSPPLAIDRVTWMSGLSIAAGLTIAGYLLLLIPAKDMEVDAPKLGVESTTTHVKGTDALSNYLLSQPASVQQAIADVLADYRKEPKRGRGGAPRRLLGSPSAPISILEWSDIRCGHCATFSETLTELDAKLPDDGLSIELRQFPLDGACNSKVMKEMHDDTDVRCTAARALICLEDKPGFRDAQERMFETQSTLSKEKVLDIAIAAGITKSELDACLVASETEAKLQSDVTDAMAYELDGTPLIVLNGKKTAGLGPFIYAMALAGGEENAPGWNVLPKPREGVGRSHDGHGH